MKRVSTYKVIGIMSGTSLDGVDIAFCTFKRIRSNWTYKINFAETIPYNRNWLHRLQEIEKSTALELALIDTEYGHYLGNLVTSFAKKYSEKADFIASHGHTIFHQPLNGLTKQIGSGGAIAAECGIPVVCDFRTKDVALGGQGAPLVPIGDELLFAKYPICLNLGGFANVSFKHNERRLAFDICPANIVLNMLSQKLGKKYDTNGDMARKGKINEKLLEQLNALSYYKQKPPKSLGKEWVLETVIPLLRKSGYNPFDLLRTYTEHIAIQIGKIGNNGVENLKKRDIDSSLYLTGGGVYNSFLIERIKTLSPKNCTIPEKLTIEFKEALIFAFLGVLRWRNEVNCLKSVTGSEKDNIGGCIYL